MKFHPWTTRQQDSLGVPTLQRRNVQEPAKYLVSTSGRGGHNAKGGCGGGGCPQYSYCKRRITLKETKF